MEKKESKLQKSKGRKQNIREESYLEKSLKELPSLPAAKNKRERDGQSNSLGIRPNFMLGDTKRIRLPFFSFFFEGAA